MKAFSKKLHSSVDFAVRQVSLLKNYFDHEVYVWEWFNDDVVDLKEDKCKGEKMWKWNPLCKINFQQKLNSLQIWQKLVFSVRVKLRISQISNGLLWKLSEIWTKSYNAQYESTWKCFIWLSFLKFHFKKLLGNSSWTFSRNLLFELP